MTSFFREQSGRQPEGVANPHGQRHVQLASQRQEQKRRSGNPASDTTSRRSNARNVVLAKHVVRPLGRRIDRKRRDGNVVEPQIKYLNN